MAPAGVEPASRWSSASRSTGELQKPAIREFRDRRTDGAPTRESRATCENATRPPACKKQPPHLPFAQMGRLHSSPGIGPELLHARVDLPPLRTVRRCEMPKPRESA